MWKPLHILALFFITSYESAVSHDRNTLSFQMHQAKEIPKLDQSGKRTQNVKENKVGSFVSPAENLMKRKLDIASKNLRIPPAENLIHSSLKDAPIVELSPGQLAKPFSVPTLTGKLVYPGPVINRSVPVLFHSFNPASGFAQCLWNCSGSVEELVEFSPNDTHYVFLSTSTDAYSDVLWMRNHFKAVTQQMLNDERISPVKAASLESRLHFVTLPVMELGNWIPLLLHQWMCLDHNCGLDQIRMESSAIQESLQRPLVAPRLDARYDWLPSASSVFGNKSVAAIFAGDGCHANTTVSDKVAMVTNTGCSYFDKVEAMQQSGSLGVVVMTTSASVQDMNCVDEECQSSLKIPASSVLFSDLVKRSADLTVHFQNSPSDRFFAAIDHEGKLAESGWFLYPSMSFLIYQAQWFEYEHKLQQRVGDATSVISIFSGATMQGSPGAQVSMSLPTLEEFSQYTRVELDLSLSCPGSDDEACPHWDHTVQLKVTPRKGTVAMEMGRWITPFRRRIGRWLSDVTPMLPLLDATLTTFTLATEPWAMAWTPSLNLCLSGKRKPGDLYPYRTDMLYSGDSFTFDKHYNSHFKPVQNFQPPKDAKKVELHSVITGHGSDENGCGEFCVTSHHYQVNGHEYNVTFHAAGSPLGCAHMVPHGSVPNEHGTWLYGRDGWCDGQDVKPWILDITDDLLQPLVGGGACNDTIRYWGYFNGTDPDPKQSPGIMIVHSYLVFYKAL